MRDLILNFQMLAMKIIVFMNFILNNNLHIFGILMNLMHIKNYYTYLQYFLTVIKTIYTMNPALHF